MWLSNVVQFVKCMGGSQPDCRGELNPGRQLMPRHPLILDGFPPAVAQTGAGAGLCLHVLSSFQRTADRLPPTQRKFPCQGNLTSLPTAPTSCQHIFDVCLSIRPGGVTTWRERKERLRSQRARQKKFAPEQLEQFVRPTGPGHARVHSLYGVAPAVSTSANPAARSPPDPILANQRTARQDLGGGGREATRARRPREDAPARRRKRGRAATPPPRARAPARRRASGAPRRPARGSA